jgi:hypothetical protein
VSCQYVYKLFTVHYITLLLRMTVGEINLHGNGKKSKKRIEEDVEDMG